MCVNFKEITISLLFEYGMSAKSKTFREPQEKTQLISCVVVLFVHFIQLFVSLPTLSISATDILDVGSVIC